MSDRGRSSTPRPLNDTDVDMENGTQDDKPDAKVVVVTHLTRNVVESHLQAIFGFYGEIVKIDLPLFGKSGQNRGKAALEYVDAASAHKAAHHMNGGQLDSSFLKVELSDLPIRGTRSRSVSPRPRTRNGRERLSRSRSPSTPPPRRRGGIDSWHGDSYQGGRGTYGRRGPPPRPSYRRSRTRSRSPPPRRNAPGLAPLRRRSPSYERGGTGYRRRSYSRSRSRSRSYSVRSSRSRSRSRSYTPSSGYRSRSPLRSPASYYSRSRSRSSRSRSRVRRSRSPRDDIRDSRSRSPT